MEMSVDVDPLEKDDYVIVYGEKIKEIGKTEKKVLEITDQTRIKTEIKQECKLGEMRHFSNSLYKEFIGFGEDDKKEMKQEYVKQEAKEDFQTSIKTEIKEECTLGKNKRKLMDEDVKIEMKEEFIEEEIKEFPGSIPKIKIEMDEDHFDLPKKAKIEKEGLSKSRKMGKNQKCPSQQQTDKNTFQTEKKWDLVPLCIVKCPECQHAEFIKNTNDVNQFSFHMKTHTAQAYTRSHPCSICSINLKVDELMEHVRIHGYCGPHSGFWNFQQNESAKKKKWCVLCPVCPSTKNANFGTRVKICNFPQHVKKAHGSFVYEKMNSEEGAFGCQGCGDSKVILTNIEVHVKWKCMESQNVTFTKPSKSDEYETDERVLGRRDKQIEYGKNTIDYDTYCRLIPKDQRKPTMPMTPIRHRKYTRRHWDWMIKTWKHNIHKVVARYNENKDNLKEEGQEGVKSCSEEMKEDEMMEDMRRRLGEDEEDDWRTASTSTDQGLESSYMPAASSLTSLDME